MMASTLRPAGLALRPALLLVLCASLCCCASPLRAPPGARPQPGPAAAGADPLRQWLRSLEIALPAQAFSFKGVNFTLSELRCGQVALGAVNSTLQGTRYSLGLTGLGLGCSGRWHGASTFAKPEQGTLALGLARNNLTLGVQLHTGHDGLAANASAFGVRAEMNVTQIEFEGADWFIRDVLKLLIPPLQQGISKALSKDLPLVLEGLIDKDLTALLQQIDAAIRPSLHPGPPPVPPPVPAGVFGGERGRGER